MKISKQIFLAFVIILLNGCNSKNSKTESTSKKIEVEVIPEVKISSEKSVEKEFRLTDDNVIDFLFDYEKSNKENHVRIYTPFGIIEILLYNNTPYHMSNFIYLTKKKYFEGTQFYRVINDFVIQAGNSDNIKVSKKRRDIGKYLLPNDFNTENDAGSLA